MKLPTTSLHLTALACISLVTPAFAVVNIDFVTVGNINNPNDPATGSLYGAVAYAYKIAKNETTISQYAEFLNAAAQTDTYGLYDTGMGSDLSVAGITRSGFSGSYSYSVVAGSGNRPISYVSWFDAARFTNWMSNGQGGGSTETGAYTLVGAMSGIFFKNAGATVWLPSENEWYKAAYYDPTPGAGGSAGTGPGPVPGPVPGGIVGDNYWRYSNQSNTLDGNTIGVARSANYYTGVFAKTQNGLPSYLTDVGAYGANSDSYYGTNDQTGNVSEWNDAVIAGSARGKSGGSWADYLGPGIQPPDVSGQRDFVVSESRFGFRIAGVPEPTSLALTLCASGALLLRRKRG